MTEHPDTTAIRDYITRRHADTNGTIALDLCDALDAARAELERERVMHRGLDPEKARYRRWWKQEKARAEAAEARIAAALVMARRRCFCSQCEGGEAEYDMEDIERALTEGTGQ